MSPLFHFCCICLIWFTLSPLTYTTLRVSQEIFLLSVLFSLGLPFKNTVWCFLSLTQNLSAPPYSLQECRILAWNTRLNTWLLHSIQPLKLQQCWIFIFFWICHVFRMAHFILHCLECCFLSIYQTSPNSVAEWKRLRFHSTAELHLRIY